MPTRDLAQVALFAALTAVLGLLPPVAVPVVPVPITAQTLGVMLAGVVLGARKGGLSQLVFLVLVAAGLPLLAGGRGGLGTLLGPSGGFVFGFPIGAFVTGLVASRLGGPTTLLRALAATFVGGILATYAIGIPYLAVVGDLPLTEAALGSLIFVPGDLVKVALASTAAVTVARALPGRFTRVQALEQP